jgi:hypothetical protein
MMLLPIMMLAAAVELPPTVRALLDDGTYTETPGGFRIITLSHVADGCAAQAQDDGPGARVCVEQVLTRARERQAKGSVEQMEGIVLTHLALILGDGDATGPCLDEALHRQAAESLVQRSMRDATGHAAGYRNTRDRWPADQAATLAAIKRYDDAHGTHLVDEPLAKFQQHMTKAMDAKTSLPWSEVHGDKSGKHPRGCALSYSVRYLAEVDKDRARRWWTAYKQHYLVDRGVLVGFREWPPGVERKGDIDSGPVVRGVGAAATAFGIAAARAMDDDMLAVRLEATAAVVEAGVSQLAPQAKRVASSTMAEAIRFHAASQPLLVDD